MTKDGKKDTRIKTLDASNRNFIALNTHVRLLSFLLNAGLTIFLAHRLQYLHALCGAALSLAAATSDRLKKIKIGRQGLQGEWESPRQSRPPGA